MRSLNSAITTYYAAGGQPQVRVLVWITAREVDSGDPASLGLWTGADTQTITVGGAERVYYAAGGLIDLDPVKSTAALMIGDWSMRVSPISPPIIAALKEYDARRAAVEVHEWHHDAVTNLPLAAPVRVFRGTISRISLPTPAEGAEAVGTVTCDSDSWRLTRPVELVRSQAALAARAPGDLARQYNSLVGVPVQWGEGLMTSPATTTPTRPATPSTTVLPVTPTGSPPPPAGGVGEWT